MFNESVVYWSFSSLFNEWMLHIEVDISVNISFQVSVFFSSEYVNITMCNILNEKNISTMNY